MNENLEWIWCVDVMLNDFHPVVIIRTQLCATQLYAARYYTQPCYAINT